MHHNSPRKKGPFVAVNAAAVPATLVESELFGHVRGAFTGATDKRIGRFEQADGGTLFIDEIGDFELGLQAKLLRVLETLTVTPVGGHEDHKVDVRVLAATRQDIRKMVEAGTFREDLYYRLNVVTINLPPLRQRPDDIPVLIDHFLREMNARSNQPPKRVSPEVIRKMMAYRWPGNVRELRHALERMLVLSDGETLVEADLPDEIRESTTGPSTQRDLPTGLTMDELEQLAITKALDACGGNRTHAAQRLNISVRTLQRKLQQYEVEKTAASTNHTNHAESDEPATPSGAGEFRSGKLTPAGPVNTTQRHVNLPPRAAFDAMRIYVACPFSVKKPSLTPRKMRQSTRWHLHCNSMPETDMVNVTPINKET